MSVEHTERNVAAHAKTDSAEAPKSLKSRKDSGRYRRRGFRFLSLPVTVGGGTTRAIFLLPDRLSGQSVRREDRRKIIMFGEIKNHSGEKLDYTFHAGEK